MNCFLIDLPITLVIAVVYIKKLEKELPKSKKVIRKIRKLRFDLSKTIKRPVPN